MSTGEQVEDAVKEALHVCIPIVEALGAVVILLGVAIGFVAYVAVVFGIRPVQFKVIRLRMGRFLALGLEFQLAADLLASAVSPTFEQIGQLAAIAAIRTLLNHVLEKEIEKEERETRAEVDACSIAQAVPPRVLPLAEAPHAA